MLLQEMQELNYKIPEMSHFLPFLHDCKPFAILFERHKICRVRKIRICISNAHLLIYLHRAWVLICIEP